MNLYSDRQVTVEDSKYVVLSELLLRAVMVTGVHRALGLRGITSSRTGVQGHSPWREVFECTMFTIKMSHFLKIG